ncbi:hypothetical protein BOX15_Mlig010305g2, partial [Macrostomum lignano]
PSFSPCLSYTKQVMLHLCSLTYFLLINLLITAASSTAIRKFSWTLQTNYVNSSLSGSCCYYSGRLVIRVGTAESETVPGSPVGSLADLSRVSVRINGLPNSDQLPAIVSLLKAARSAEQLEFTGPVRVLYLYQPLQSLPKLTHLKAACTTQQSDFELISELDNAKNKALIDVELHNCIWRNRSSVLLNNLASLVSAKYNGGRLDQLSVGEIKGLPNLRYLILLNCDLVSIEVGAFDDLQALLQLTVSGNPRLKVLPAGVLRNLINLSSLSLRSNGLQDVASAFNGLGLKLLERLDLAGNELSWLPAGTFQGLGRLRTLRLDGNPLLRLADKPCIALCSLTSLRTLKFDAKLGKEDAAGVAATICNRIALNSTGNVRLLMQAGVRPQPLKLNCPPGNGVLCRQKRLLQPLRADGAEKKQEESLQQQQAQSHPNMALLIIFGAICLAHLAVTIALACVCWRAVRGRRHQNWRHRQADQLTAPAACVKNLLTSDEIGSFGLSEEAGGNGGGGLTTASTSSESAAAVLISFRSRASDARAGEKDYKIGDGIHPRQKICYEFNEEA